MLRGTCALVTLTLMLLGATAGLARPAPQSQPASPQSQPAPRVVVPFAPVAWGEYETVVTGSRALQLRFESDRSIGTLTRARLDETQARSVPDALEEIAGVFVQQTNRGAGAPIIRGLVGPQNLILVDGIPFNTATFRTGPNQYLALLDPFATERLEVVRGPSSVLYGNGAMGGVVHVLTRGPSPDGGPARLGADAEARFASADLARGFALRVTPSVGHLATMVAAHFDWFDTLRAGGGADQPRSAYRAGYWQAKAVYSPGAPWSLTGAYLGAILRDAGRTDSAGKGDVRFYDNDDHLAYALFKWRGHGVVREAHARVFYHQLREDTDRFSCATTDSVVSDLAGCLRLDATQVTTARRYRDRTDVRGGDLGVQLEPIARRLTLRAGLELGEEFVESSLRTAKAADGFRATAGTGNYAPGSRYLSLGTYLQGTARLWDVGPRVGQLQLTAGGRFTHVAAVAPNVPDFGDVDHGYSGGVGSAGLQLLRPGRHNLYVTFVQGFRPPNLQETTLTGDTGQKFAVPNPALAPEKSNTVEAGGKLALGAVHAEAAYFFSLNRDAIVWQAATYQGQPEYQGKSVVRMVNAQQGAFHGVEGSLAAHLWRLTATATASWIRGAVRLEDGSTVPAQRVPPAFGSAALRYDHPGRRVAVEAIVRWAAAQHRLNPEDRKDLRICETAPFSGVLADPCQGTPAWATLNLRGVWHVDRRLSVNLLVANLTDARYRVHGAGFEAPGVDARVTLQARF